MQGSKNLGLDWPQEVCFGELTTPPTQVQRKEHFERIQMNSVQSNE
jgi:hypothetical protein